MAAGISQQKLNRALKKLQAQNPGVEYQVLRASNGEVAIVPIKKSECCLIIASCHDAQARCCCGGWSLCRTGHMTREAIETEYKLHAEVQ